MSKRLKRHLDSQPDLALSATDRKDGLVHSIQSWFIGAASSCWSHISSYIFCVSLDCGFRPAVSPGALPSESVALRLEKQVLCSF